MSAAPTPAMRRTSAAGEQRFSDVLTMSLDVVDIEDESVLKHVSLLNPQGESIVPCHLSHH